MPDSPSPSPSPSHLLYIDESGTKEYAPSVDMYGTGITRFLVLCAVILRPADVGVLSGQLRVMKEACFGTPDVELKSNWLRIPKERQKHYLVPFGVSENKLREFVDDYYVALNAARLMFLATVVDKVRVKELYPTNPWYPPAIAYELIVQRLQNEIAPDGMASIVMDDMSGATPKNNPYKTNLAKQHDKLRKFGFALRRGKSVTCLHGQLRFRNSKHSELLQVADLIAYNVFRQFTDHGDEWEEPGRHELPTYEYLERVAEKFRTGPNGRVQGYGIVKFPLKRRVPWTLEPTT